MRTRFGVGSVSKKRQDFESSDNFGKQRGHGLFSSIVIGNPSVSIPPFQLHA